MEPTAIAVSKQHNVARAHGQLFGAVRGRERPRSGAIARRNWPRDRAPPARKARVSAHSCDAPSARPRSLRFCVLFCLHATKTGLTTRQGRVSASRSRPPKGAEGMDGSARQTLLLAPCFLKKVRNECRVLLSYPFHRWGFDGGAFPFPDPSGNFPPIPAFAQNTPFTN